MTTTRPRNSIRKKVLTRTFALSLAPLLVIAVIGVLLISRLDGSIHDSVETSETELADTIVGQNLNRTAVAASNSIEGYMQERLEDLTLWAQNDAIIEAARTGGSLEDNQDAAAFLTNHNQLPQWLNLTVTDDSGAVAARAESTTVTNLSDLPVWSTAMETGVAIGEVYRDGDVMVMDVAVRIDDDDSGDTVGVFVGNLDAGFFAQIADDFSNATDGVQQVSVLIDDDVLVAETSTEHADDRLLNADAQFEGAKGPLVEQITGEIHSEESHLAEGAAPEEGHSDEIHADEANADEGHGEEGHADEGHGDEGHTDEGHGDEGHGEDGQGDEGQAGHADGGEHVDRTDTTFLGHAATTDVNASITPDSPAHLGAIVLVEQDFDTIATVTGPLEGISETFDKSTRNLALIALLVIALAIAAVWFVAQILTRGIVTPINQLVTEAQEVTTTRLPNTIAEVTSSDTDETPEVEPVIIDSDDEIGELADAFNSVQSTAVGLAGEQAIIRRNISDLFVYLGRRNQNLLARELGVVDALERGEEDPDVLERLFDLDHLITRMRRNAEALLIIAGEEPTRTWSKPVKVPNLVRSAAAEVEDYTRVQMGSFEEGAVRGDAVSDIAHLLAELLENALKHSPPTTKVQVAGRQIREGYGIAITDHGVGLTDEELADTNARLKAPSGFDRLPTAYLGLYVVARLAARHEIQVQLVHGEQGGLTAWVYLPPALAGSDPDDERDPALPSDLGGGAPSPTGPEPAPSPAPQPAATAPAPQPTAPVAQPTAQPTPQPAAPVAQPTASAAPQAVPPAEPTAEPIQASAPTAPSTNGDSTPEPQVFQPTAEEATPPSMPAVLDDLAPPVASGTAAPGSPAPTSASMPHDSVADLPLMETMPTADVPDSADRLVAPTTTSAGLKRRSNRRDATEGLKADPVGAEKTDTAAPPRSAAEVADRLHQFQSAVERGREMRATDPNGGRDR